MELIDRYQQAIDELLLKVRTTQRDAIQKAGETVAEAVEHGRHIYLGEIGHSIQKDSIERGGGPAFYRPYEEEKTELKPGDVLFVSSVSGRTLKVVNLAYDSVQAGVKVIAFTSMEYARAVDPVHPSGKKLYEIATHVLDNCAPPAEAMLEVDGLDARFAPASGISADYIMWSLTSVAVDKMLRDGYQPGIYKSINFPGGQEYFEEINRHYAEFGW